MKVLLIISVACWLHLATSQQTCPPGVPIYQCFIDPCTTADCPGNPTATCRSNYCGGCNAHFYDSNGINVTESCTGCSNGMIYLSCGSYCRNNLTCTGYLDGAPACPSVCVSGCFCPNGTVVRNGQCVPTSQCSSPPTTPPPVNVTVPPPSAVCNTSDGRTYRAGESYPHPDGCNTCTCTSSGASLCTLIACIGCVDEAGVHHRIGESFNLRNNPCSPCMCTTSGEVVCAVVDCVPPEYLNCQNGLTPVYQEGFCCPVCPNVTVITTTSIPIAECRTSDGRVYHAGQTFLAPDGCNTCICTSTGVAACTEIACPDVCVQTGAVTGRCRGYFPRYFYNVTSQTCQRFIYGGCDGNGNNFETEQACIQRCSVCYKPIYPPNFMPVCDVIIRQWTYNTERRQCEEFNYSPCGEQRDGYNVFQTEQECINRCGRLISTQTPPTLPTPTCANGMIYETCGTACPLTCDNYRNAPLPCTRQCVQGCFCPQGMVLNNGRCVAPSDCPVTPTCTNGMVYESCGTACPVTCENRNSPPRPCPAICRQGCFCPQGLVEYNGGCVEPSECPAPTCTNGKVYETCGTACPLTCDNYQNAASIICTQQCVQGCFCPHGMVDNNGQCVAPSDCPAACTDDQFACSNGSCIPGSYRCDGLRDCTFGEDEADCPRTCDFMCGDGVCIPEDHVCDDYVDCRNGRDERGCTDLGDFENTVYPETIPQQCPNATGLLGSCAEECSSDSDCDEDNLCCFNGCGRSCIAGTPADPLCPALRRQSDTPLLGAFIPSCETDGSFSQVQCQGSFCWCVDAVSGEPLADGVGLPEQPQCGVCTDHNGRTYASGQSFPSEDGCNTCYCTPTGNALCSLRACAPVACSLKDVTIDHTGVYDDDCSSCQCQFGQLSCQKKNCPIKTDTRPTKVNMTFDGDLDRVAPTDDHKENLKREMMRTMLTNYGQTLALSQHQLNSVEVMKGSVIFVITLTGTDSTAAGANLTILLSQLQQDYMSGSFVIRYNSQVLQPTGSIQVEEPEDEIGEFPWWGILMVSVGGLLVVISVVVLIAVVILFRKTGQRHNNKVNYVTYKAEDEDVDVKQPFS